MVRIQPDHDLRGVTSPSNVPLLFSVLCDWEDIGGHWTIRFRGHNLCFGEQQQYAIHVFIWTWDVKHYLSIYAGCGEEPDRV